MGHRSSRADGDLTSVTDPDGNVTTTTYDADGRPTVTIDPNGALATLRGRKRGHRKTEKKDGKGVIAKY